MPCCGINGQATIPNPSVSAFPLYHHPRTHTTQRRAAAAVGARGQQARREREGYIFGAETRIVALLGRRGR